MLEQIIYNEMTYWLLFTAVVFTYVGRLITFRIHLEDVITATIESLIDDGYSRTKGEGDKLELLKHWEYKDES